MDGDKLVGIFSERDYAREMVLKGRSSKTTNVSEVMTKEVLTASPNDLVDTAMSLMTEKRIRHLPIVENGQVLGMLSVGDLVKETISYQKQLIAQLEQYIRG
jgi:signal-transduction protein with cAMP-binding, CBS, and nucleotidyltransferase domain